MQHKDVIFSTQVYRVCKCDLHIYYVNIAYSHFQFSLAVKVSLVIPHI